MDKTIGFLCKEDLFFGRTIEAEVKLNHKIISY